MKKTMKMHLPIVIVLSALTLCSCGKQQAINHNVPKPSIVEKETVKGELQKANLIHDDKFGGVYINISIEDFNKLGFTFGDSVNILFSTGYYMEDIPYYNGYYVDMGEPILAGYPGLDYIRVGINYGEDLWELADLKEDSTCTITINEKAKYLDIQKLRDLHYSDVQGDMSDEVFGNFRAIKVGNIKDNLIYRGASPIDNKHNRAPVVDKLLQREKIKCIVDLADNAEEIVSFLEVDCFNSPYFMELYNNDKVKVLSMNMQFAADDFANKLIDGLQHIINNDGPYFVHCQEGKDRTGYVSMIIGALAGGSYEELVADYMKTYENYYKITKEKDLDRYNTIKEKNIDEMIRHMVGDEDVNIEDVDLEKAVENYLLRIGMKSDDISTLKSKITK